MKSIVVYSVIITLLLSLAQFNLQMPLAEKSITKRYSKMNVRNVTEEMVKGLKEERNSVLVILQMLNGRLL